MTPQASTTSLRELKTWQRVRLITGGLVICAAMATVVIGLVALRNGRDTWSAMRLPIVLALVSLAGFVHAQRKTLPPIKPNHAGTPIRKE